MEIGLSVSLCITDIIEGRVAIQDVAMIIAGTNCQGDWESLLKNYSETYWCGKEKKAREILFSLVAKNKIVEPRALDWPAPAFYSSYWLEADAATYPSNNYGDTPMQEYSIAELLKANA